MSVRDSARKTRDDGVTILRLCVWAGEAPAEPRM